MKKPEFSKFLATVIIVADVVLSVSTLALCYMAIKYNYSGSLPYLTALIGLYQAATGYVLGKYLDMAKSDHSVGGITFESAKAKNFIKDPDEPTI
jgi:hypothetical protein